MNNKPKKQTGKTISRIQQLTSYGWNDLIKLRMDLKKKHTGTLRIYRTQVESLKLWELELYCFKSGMSKLYEKGWVIPELTTEKLSSTKHLIKLIKRYITNNVDKIKESKKRIKILQSNIRDISNIINEAYAKYPKHLNEKFNVRKVIYTDGTQHIDAVVVKHTQPDLNNLNDISKLEDIRW